MGDSRRSRLVPPFSWRSNRTVSLGATPLTQGPGMMRARLRGMVQENHGDRFLGTEIDHPAEPGVRPGKEIENGIESGRAPLRPSRTATCQTGLPGADRGARTGIGESGRGTEIATAKEKEIESGRGSEAATGSATGSATATATATATEIVIAIATGIGKGTVGAGGIAPDLLLVGRRRDGVSRDEPFLGDGRRLGRPGGRGSGRGRETRAGTTIAIPG